MAGALAGGWITDPTAGDYDALAVQAQTFATAMDLALTNDGTISAGGGTATTGAGSSTLVEYQSMKPALLQAIVFGVTFSRYQTGAAAAVFTTSIAAIKAAYTQCITKGLFT